MVARRGVTGRGDGGGRYVQLMSEHTWLAYDATSIQQRFEGAREYTGPLADEIKDLDSLASDLDNCIEALDLRTAQEGGKVRNYLWQQALVSYGRCFSTGVRLTVSPVKFLRLLPESFRERHETAMAMRNRFVAHSVNGMEVPMITFHATAAGIASVETTNIRMSPESDESPNELRELADALRAVMRTREEMLIRRVEAELKAVPLATLLAQPEIRLEMIPTRQMEKKARHSRTKKPKGSTSS